MPRIVPLLLAAALACGCASYHDPAPKPGTPDPLAFGALIETDRTLANDFDGRLSGSEGYDRAAAWAADRFRALGLEPAGDDGWFQRLPMEHNAIETCRLALVGEDGATVPVDLGTDVACRGFTGSGTVSAPVVFAGWGLSAPDRGRDDYAGLDVRGKVVLVLKDAPPLTKGETPWGAAALPRGKARIAADHGAVALLMVTPPGAKDRRPIGSVLHGDGVQNESFPQLHVAPRIAERLFEGSGETLDQAFLKLAAGAHSRPLARSVSIDVRAHYRAAAPTENVVARLAGTDLASETLVIGAHLDHVGRQAAAVLYPGANDNASGSAALLGIAAAFAQSTERPRRTLLFVLFTGEEQGTNGSRWFVEHAPLALDRVVAMINLDCVGHGTGRINLGGGKSAPTLYALARSIDRATGRFVAGETWHGGGADAEAFFAKGIPTIYFHSEGSYTHLHRPEDTPETLGPALERSARLAYRLAREVAAGHYEREALAKP